MSWYKTNPLWSDKEYVMSQVLTCGARYLRYVDPKLQNDKEVVLAAVNRDGDALQYASSDLRNDKEVVLAAISDLRTAYQYASPLLQQDKDVLFLAQTPYF